MKSERRREVINICLDHFIERGLYATSTRSLSSALKLQNAGLYYYFSSKDEAVIACAEEATIRLENELIVAALDNLSDLDRMMRLLEEKAEEMAPTMRFLTSVCSSETYRRAVRPVLDQMAVRYGQYADQLAQSLECGKKEVEAYLYMIITAVSNYMIFGEKQYIAPQMNFVKKGIKRLQKKAGAPSEEEVQ